ncbi:DNA cytosine methyltransferase [Elioraea sp.]|uniref:DNA cytosine methyltransferase n=1 Tax=Elioraea sp. TaxID=2185103 RepID=UPI0025B7C214|nr:DNA cytosine methyltransferase [Elioraea sp.]
MAIRGIDLFCGGGGSSWGARAAGVEMVGAVDAWGMAAATYRRNFPNARVVQTRLNRRSDRALLGDLGHVDLVLASPECTSHTPARGARVKDEASRATAFHVLKFIRNLSPRWAVIENVIQMRSWERYTNFLAALKEHMHVTEHVLDAQDFGVPQTRRRIFLMCSKDEPPERPRPLADRRRTVTDILAPTGTYKTRPLFDGGLAEPTIARARRAIETLGREIPFLIVYYSSDGAGGWQPLDRPIRTLTTLDRFGLVEWIGGEPRMRMLQVDELQRAMGFSDDYVLDQGTRRDKIKMLGNGVCPPVMQSVVSALIGSATTYASRTSDALDHRMGAGFPVIQTPDVSGILPAI